MLLHKPAGSRLFGLVHYPLANHQYLLRIHVLDKKILLFNGTEIALKHMRQRSIMNRYGA
jgi:hypothetical protein